MAKTHDPIERGDEDDRLVEVIMRQFNLRSRAEAVNKISRWVAGEPMTREEVLAMEGANIRDDVPTDRPPRRVDR